MPRSAPMHRRRRLASRRRLQQTWRHVVAESRYLQLVWRTFRWSLLFTMAVWTASVLILHESYPVAPGEDPMSWSRSAYVVLLMTAFEGAIEYHPGAPLAVKAVFFALPLLGLFVIIDAIVRFTGLVFQRRVNTKEWQALLASTYHRHVIVCGLGHVGYRIVQQLVASGSDCVAIEQRETEFVAEVQALGVPVIMGDVRKAESLRQAGIERASALIAATDVDLVNIETGLNARELNDDIKVVLRLFDQALAKKIEKSSSFDVALSTSALAAPVFAAAAVTRNVINSFVVGDKVLNTVELTVAPGSRLDGRTIDGLRAELEVTFLMREPVGGVVDWNPDPALHLAGGDKLLVVTTLEALAALETLNLEPGRLAGTTTRLMDWFAGRQGRSSQA